MHTTDYERHNSKHKWLRHDGIRHDIETVHQGHVDWNNFSDAGQITHEWLVVRRTKDLDHQSHREWEDDAAEYAENQWKCGHHARHTFVFIRHIATAKKNTKLMTVTLHWACGTLFLSLLLYTDMIINAWSHQTAESTLWSLKLNLYKHCLQLFVEVGRWGSSLTGAGRLFHNREAVTVHGHMYV